MTKSPRQNRQLSRTKDWAQAFYHSFEWRSLRYEILKRDGARCALCGATKEDGRVMNVDHKLPLRKFPDLSLEPDNLQVLCNACNHGKANKIATREEGELVLKFCHTAINRFGVDEHHLCEEILSRCRKGEIGDIISLLLELVYESGEISGAQSAYNRIGANG